MKDKEEKKPKEHRTLDQTLADLEKAGIRVTKFDDMTAENVDVVPTGSITLDIATGVNGYPKGRIVEIFGPESGGKTTLSIIAMAQAQKAGGKAAFIDVEHSFSPTWARKLGVNIKELYFNQPDYGEQALDTTVKLLETNAFDIIVLDSTAALIPKSELEGNIEDQTMGTHARLMSKALRKITSIASKSKTTVVFINQLREKIGVMFGNPETTTGGKALRFYSSMRVRVDVVSKSSVENSKGEKIGHRVRAKVVKNKCAAPFREAEFFLNFETGIDNDSEILDAALTKEIIKLDGRTYTFKNWTAVGREKCAELLNTTPEFKKEVLDIIRKGVDDDVPIELDRVDGDVVTDQEIDSGGVVNTTLRLPKKKRKKSEE